jgi:hypothetical protein
MKSVQTLSISGTSKNWAHMTCIKCCLDVAFTSQIGQLTILARVAQMLAQITCKHSLLDYSFQLQMVSCWTIVEK